MIKDSALRMKFIDIESRILSKIIYKEENEGKVKELEEHI